MSSLQDTQKGYPTEELVIGLSVSGEGARNLLFGIPRICNSDPAADPADLRHRGAGTISRCGEK